ncbi:hypothetical protein UCRPC4_g06308 [Phaeomoniella chlamydospora]|uniref:Uncharacterized protein n=1 Tax=Phaeomoniella chlamydospora TaxID=158046 RepID=A0A0G2GEQ0_PHACM|nr:hypothetical protein UCRPC4_g06308 [Phaeomoniella chlamydospora]
MLHATSTSPEPSSVIGKRKRSASPEKAANSAVAPPDIAIEADSEQLKKDLSILLHIVESHSYKPLLSKPLPPSETLQSDTKRPRLSDGAQGDTISLRIETGSYQSTEAVVNDIQTLLDHQANLSNGHAAQNGDDTQREALKNALSKFTLERSLRSRKIKSEDDTVDTTNLETVPSADSAIYRMALTLFGNTDRGPRQLFSSLQLATETEPQGESGQNYVSSRLLYPKLEEDLLPNGITATKAVPFNAQNASAEKRKDATFGQIFRPHPSLKALEPPKPPKTTPKSSALSWVQPIVNATLLRNPQTDKGHYKSSALPAGQWLRYSGPKTKNELVTFNEQLGREKGAVFNDRGNNSSPDDVQAAKQKSLFLSAYSSFAPAYDDGGSIISQAVKSQVWWRKTGSSQFAAMVQSEEYPNDIPPSFRNEEHVPSTANDDDFSEAVESFNTDGTEPEQADEQKASDDKDLDELLEEISDHLKTLSSYQKLRQSSQSTGKVVNGEQEAFSTPTSMESEVYQMLKTQLSLMISSLPPYAVAKLDGDQLRSLNIGTKIVTPLDDYAGVMDVDEYTYAKQRAAASANAAASRPSVPNQVRTGSYNAVSTPLTGYNQRSFSTNNRPAAAGTSYTNRPAYAGATPSQNYATAGRPMPQTVPRYSAQQPYNNSPSVQPFQRPIPNGYEGTFQSHQQGQNGPGFPQRPSQPGYQQRAQDTAARFGSPQKPFEMLSRNQIPAGGQQPRYFQQQQQSPQPGSQASSNVSVASATPQNSYNQMDRARGSAQIAGQRPPSTTPQPPNGQNVERSATPGGGQQNGVTPSATPLNI